LNGRYRRHSGHWPEQALNDSVANDPQRTCRDYRLLNDIERLKSLLRGPRNNEGRLDAIYFGLVVLLQRDAEKGKT
jgi:hypothetical protein